MNYCPKCGSPVNEGANYCPKCGTRTASDGCLMMKIVRNSSLVAALMPYKVIINGVEHGRLFNGKEMMLTVPREPFQLSVEMVGNCMTFHPIETRTVVTPEPQHNRIDCFISTILQAEGVFTFGMSKAPGRIEIGVIYR